MHSIDLNNNNKQQKEVIKIVEDLKRNKVENIEDYKEEITLPKEIK